MKPNKPIILLNALLQGQIIETGNCKYKLVDNGFCQQFNRINTITGKEYKVWLPIQSRLKNFIIWANTFTDEEVFIISSNVVLNDIKREKNEK